MHFPCQLLAIYNRVALTNKPIVWRNSARRQLRNGGVSERLSRACFSFSDALRREIFGGPHCFPGHPSAHQMAELVHRWVFQRVNHKQSLFAAGDEFALVQNGQVLGDICLAEAALLDELAYRLLTFHEQPEQTQAGTVCQDAEQAGGLLNLRRSDELLVVRVRCWVHGRRAIFAL